MDTNESLNRTFSALSDPTRRALLKMVSESEKSVTELAQPFMNRMSLPAITKHLKVLEKAHLISRTQTAQWRPCRLNSAPLQEVSHWMAQFQKYWEESLDRLEDYLKSLENTDGSLQNSMPTRTLHAHPKKPKYHRSRQGDKKKSKQPRPKKRKVHET